MQADTITLAVDELNNSTTVDHVYRRSDEDRNRSIYAGPDHSLIAKETMTFYRTANKKVGNFNGVAKSAVKFVKDISVPGVDASTTIVAPMIGEISFSLPVGFTAAAALEFRQTLLAVLDDDTVMSKLSELLEI